MLTPAATETRLAVLALAVAPSRRASQRFCALYATGGDSVLELDDPDRIAALAEGTPVVTASPRSAQRLVESAVVWDVLELASLLAPECPAGSLDRAASFCGLSRQTTGLQGEARLTLGVFQVLLAILDQTDTQTLLHATRLARPLDWPLRLLFSELERARAKSTLETGALAEAAPLGGWIAQGAPARRRPSHEPPPAPTLLDVAEVAERLSPSGPIAHALPAYEPREQQVQMARLVAETLNTGGQTLLEAGTGVGKALDVDTPMPTPSGWTRMGDLRIGDAIFDEQGKPTHVTAAFDIRYDRPCYEIEFSDGSTLVADAEHEWLTYTSRDRKWAGRPRGETYKSKNFVQQTTLDALRTTLERLPRHAELSRTDAQRLVGGHGWSVRQAALATRPTTDGVVARYAARELLPHLLRRLERDFVEQRRDGHAYSLLTTEQIAESLRVTAAGRSNHAIPVAGPLALPEAKLPVDPYFLGAWLGDGTSRSSQITTADPEVLCEIALAGYATRKLSNRYLHAVDDENRKARSRWQRGLTGRLRALGVIQNKHIPNAYLRASERQRTALLAGLLDTDGTVSVNGAVQFTTTHPRLSEGLHELACSLGFRPTVMQGHARLHGRDCGPKSTIHFTTDQQVYRLPRKVAAHRERLRNYSRPRNRFRYIVSVRPVPTRPVRCIQVDAPSHLYLAGTSFIPTHNSLAYLLPAALQAVRNRSRVVVSTATITLQDQLFEKDLPVVQAVLGSDGQPLRATVLKGRANYLCLRRWQTLLHATDLLPEERSLLIKTLFWLPRTRTGDRAELRLTPAEEQAWQRLSALAEACTPQRCPYHRIGVCFLARARRAAEESHIVIANHALLLSDLVTRSRVLPEYQVLVVDEAHHLEDEATQQLGWRLTERELLNRLERLWSPGVGHHGTGAVAEALALIAAADGLRVPSDLLGELEHGERAVTDLGAGIRRFFEGLAELLGDADVQGGGDETTLRLSHAVRAGSRWQELEAVWADASQQLEVVERVVGSLEDRLHGLADSPEGAAKALAAELGSQLDTWRDVRRRLGAAVHAPDTGTVYWLASSPRQRSAWLSAAPLDVAALLRDKLFAAPEATVLVSATLAIGGSFDYVKRRLGLEEARSSGLGSPFDYRRNALLYVPNDLPDPTQAGHQAVLERVLLDTVTRVGGRTLVLFTSRAHLRSTYTALREPLANLGITLLGQGINEGSRTRLLDTFRRGSRVVLFGTNAFWEGIDIVGEALSLVVMVRLPFAVPTDPVYTARAEQFDEPFSQYALPQAVLRLKQGFGRLIRSRSDRGAVVVLDRRLVTRSYGSIFVRSLPPCSVKQGPARRTTVEVGEWLNEPLAQQLRLD